MSEREIRNLSIPEGLNQERVDAALSRLLGLSRNVIVGLIEHGEISKDGKAVGKSDRVATGDQLEILLPAAKGEAKLVATPIDGLKVVYDDEYLIVIDKPVGIAAHPSPGWQGATVVGAIFAAGYQLATSGAAERQGVVHRLDVGTSGLMPSITHYKTLEVFPAVTLLEIELETGRTHQIRVHFSALHHPLVGDLTYGSDPALATRLGITRPWLHAKQLAFDHPASGERLSFNAEYPADLTRSLEVLSDISR
jgi:23S rRNA-/tRNA-specific pseudouridylate synthase